jgi:protein-tyrosine-phosphatase
MAAAYFSNKLKERQISNDWVVDSAGTWTENSIPITPMAMEFAATRGFNLEGHVSKMIEDVDIFSHDLIIVMENGQKEALQVEFENIDDKTYLLTAFSGVPYDIPDPAGQDEEDALIILAEVIDLVDHGFNEIIQIGEKGT